MKIVVVLMPKIVGGRIDQSQFELFTSLDVSAEFIPAPRKSLLKTKSRQEELKLCSVGYINVYLSISSKSAWNSTAGDRICRPVKLNGFAKVVAVWPLQKSALLLLPLLLGHWPLLICQTYADLTQMGLSMSVRKLFTSGQTSRGRDTCRGRGGGGSFYGGETQFKADNRSGVTTGTRPLDRSVAFDAETEGRLLLDQLFLSRFITP